MNAWRRPRRCEPTGPSPALGRGRRRPAGARRLPRLRASLLPAALLPAVACERAHEWHEGSGFRWRELHVEGGREGFEAVPPDRSGVGFANALSDSLLATNEILANGSGVALGDVDGDGLADLYLCRLEGPNALYLNRGGWRFEDVTERAGVALADRFSRGAVLADLDGDGDQDLLVTAHGAPKAVFLNDGTGVFEDASDASGLEGRLAANTPALADIDGDGDLDLYVGNYKRRWVRDLFPPEERAFDRVVVRRGEDPANWEIAPEFREHYRLLVDRTGPRRWEFAEPDELWLNRGGGRFERASWTDGRFLDEDGRPLERAPDEWALAARFGDFDRDGDPDLYVANDLESPDHLWLNRGDGSFRLAPRLALRTTSAASMSVDFSDVERDGDVDLFVAEMLSPDPARRKRQVVVMMPDIQFPGAYLERAQANRNTLQLARGDGTWAEVAWWAGVAASEWTWGSLFADVDLDGYEDILVANGHAVDPLDGDTQERIAYGRDRSDWETMLLRYPSLRTRNLAFRNLGDGRFAPAPEWGFGPEEDVSHALATGDLDGDGDLDVAVNRLGSPALLLRNGTAAPRVAVRLAGRAPNTRGIGARVRLLGGAVPVQEKEVTAGGLYLSSSEPLVSLAAAGEGAGDMELEVVWPSGRRSRVADVRGGRLYEIREEAAGPPAAPGDGDAPPPGSVEGVASSAAVGEGAGRSAPAGHPPLFRDVSAALGHVHAETLFNDFSRQPLLPYRLSELGPGASWEDVDGDGDPDLVVGAGRGGRLAVFRNDTRPGGPPRFGRVDSGLPAARYDLTTTVGLPDGEGGTRLLVGRMTYEAPTPEEARSAASVLAVSPAARPASTEAPPTSTEAVPGDPASVGPLALADLDADGDLDLFVGGRVYPTAYPTPPSSRIFRNRGGELELDAGLSEPLREVGMVSAAVFSDVDGDGDADLLAAVEWGPIALFLNEGGRLVEATEAWGLAAWTGRWNGIATGDLDGDGRPDLVATNWGLNTEWEATPERPLHLYWGDFDGNGTLEVLEARWQPHVGAVAPLRALHTLARAMPFVRRTTPTHEAYAGASLERVLGPAARSARRTRAATLAHTLFLNRGGRFEARPLPAEAQWAPAFGVAVADADGDGREDVLLAQNFSGTEIPSELMSTELALSPRYDAGRGLWLRGDGRGGLAATPAGESGIEVYGDGRGAAVADFDGDGRVDLVVGQNGAATKLYHNRGAAPGLRVRLAGRSSNPDGVGAAVRVEYADGGTGPLREVQAGSGWWSRNGSVQVLGLEAGREPRTVRVRWPGGRETTVGVPAGAREVTAPAPGPREMATAPSPGAAPRRATPPGRPGPRESER